MTRKLSVTLLLGAVLVAVAAQRLVAQEKEKNPEEGKKGTTLGVLVEKGKDAIFVRGDGEEKPRRFVPQWKGGAPADGGGFDKDVLKTFAKLQVGSRVEVSWVFEERLRALNVKVLAPPKGDKKGKD